MREKDNTKPKSWRDLIKVHPAADLFPMMGPDELRALGEDIKKNGMTSDVYLWEADKGEELVLLDGRNRLDAMEMVGLPVLNDGGHLNVRLFGGPVRCEHLRGPGGGGGITDPWKFVVSANIHRRHLTPEQKRELVAKLLKAVPGKSNRETAKLAKVDDKTVAKVRRKLEATAELPQLTKTTGADGKARSARAPKPTQSDLEEFTNKPQPAPKWSPWERERRARTKDGVAVVASKRRDHALIAWAEANDRIVLIDRQSIWGNPFEMGDEKDPKDGDRATVIENYRWYLERRPSLRRKLDLLRGKVLVCWCHPEPCHGDVLCDLVNDEPRAANGQIDPLEVPAFLLRGAATVAAD